MKTDLKATLENKIKSVITEYNSKGQTTIEKKELDKLIKVCASKLDKNISDDDVKKLESKYSQVVANTMKVEDIEPLVSSILNAIDESTQKKYSKVIEKGDVVSVPFGGKILCGVVTNVAPDKLTINNYTTDNILVPNNNLVYKFFPGQKYDLREFERVDENTTEKLSLKEKLNKFFSKTTVGSYDSFLKNNKGDLVQLLKGQMTNTMFNGSSIVKNEKGEQELKNWSCKFQLFRGPDNFLKLNTAWKQEKLQTKVYGVELTAEQIKNTVEKKQSIVIDRTTGTGVAFKAFCKYDSDLNSFVTSQHDVKIEERMKASYSKKETENQSQKEGPKKEELKEIQKETQRKGKGRSI